jgi:hypothetical protein
MTVQATGDCYQVAYDVVTEEDQGLLLCHGTATGQGPIEGIRFGHAWVENPEAGTALDFSNDSNVCMARERYYEIGQIDEDDVVRYSFEEALVNALHYRHFGPWDE